MRPNVDDQVRVIRFADKVFRMDVPEQSDLIAQRIADGSYEAPLPFLMMATLLRTEGAFLDVGANTGVYSVLAGILSQTVGILAFEPLPTVLPILRRNLALNGLAERVQVFDCALSDRSGTARLHIPDPGHGLTETSASLQTDFQPAHTIIDVPIRRLDEIAIADTVAVIKVDIEGHEHKFLHGARETIRRDRPFVFAEVVGPAKRGAIGAFLHDVGYMDFRLRPDMAIHDGEVLFDNAAWNHALVPIERLGKFREICDSCELPMLRRFQLS